MKRFLLSLVLIFLTINTLFAQRDTEHWIAPYYDSYGGNTYTNMIYLSTDSPTPFDVTIYNNNAPVTTVTISKGNPQTYKVTNSLISATTTTEAFTVGNKGLYLKAAKPFYCSLRLAQSVHGEVITSKGKAGIGKTFFVAAAPNTYTSSIQNFTAGVLATEDNTNVTVSWNPTAGVVFINGSPTGNTQTFTLQKGQSFILAGSGTQSGNLTGFIGAKIVSDKPITLTNGSCNANFSASTSGSDPVLDQSVPVDRLGNTFAMVKTRSTAPNLNMEGGLIVATEDNTQVFLNGGGTSVATLAAGEWYRINETSYVAQGTSGHSNMFISTTKNVYLYQFIGILGSDATNGFNYIPPLNCFLPRKIDEIGKINEMPIGSGGASAVQDIIVKLNILTETGATVMVNDAPVAATDGPYPVTGNTNWVTYGITGVSGNIKITST